MSASTHENAPWRTTRPGLSVLIPFLHDDPTDLLTLLDREAAMLDGRAELILLDDGAADSALTARLTAQIDNLALPVRLITWPPTRAGPRVATGWPPPRAGPACCS